ncbi:DUF2269 family protein [Algihabitans albus]|uniref:DUF2269 family protein n=1 Tax=Algihabitans albus TaxID=2164067 RepID=UPI000E5D7A04|nr:DUF2269 family protein [Algihabitans albus]
MRKAMKILHTLAAAGLLGGLSVYMLLLVAAPQDTPAAYLDLRVSIAAISNYILLPSLAIALLSGLASMVVHDPYLHKGWVWLKAALGILMFKGILTVVGAKADYALSVAERIVEGEVAAEVLERAVAYEWATLVVMMALSVANVVLGVWRPRLGSAPARSGARRAPAPSLAGDGASEPKERVRPAA